MRLLAGMVLAMVLFAACGGESEPAAPAATATRAAPSPSAAASPSPVAATPARPSGGATVSPTSPPPAPSANTTELVHLGTKTGPDSTRPGYAVAYIRLAVRHPVPEARYPEFPREAVLTISEGRTYSGQLALMTEALAARPAPNPLVVIGDSGRAINIAFERVPGLTSCLVERGAGFVPELLTLVAAVSYPEAGTPSRLAIEGFPPVALSASPAPVRCGFAAAPALESLPKTAETPAATVTLARGGAIRGNCESLRCIDKAQAAAYTLTITNRSAIDDLRDAPMLSVVRGIDTEGVLRWAIGCGGSGSTASIGPRQSATTVFCVSTFVHPGHESGAALQAILVRSGGAIVLVRP